MLTIKAETGNETVGIGTDVNGRLEVTFDRLDLDDLINQIGWGHVLDAIGKDEAIKHFEITTEAQ